MTELRLAVVNGEPTMHVSLDPIADQFIALGEAICAGKIAVEKAVIVAEVDGAITYTPVGHVTIVEGIGMLEMASRKIERDALGE